MKNMLVLVASAAVVLACGQVSAEVEAVWNASETPDTLAGGALAFTYEDGKVKTVTVTPSEGETVVLSGDTMTFAAGAEVRMASGGKLAFANALAGEGKLTVKDVRADATIEYSGALLATNRWTKMFSGRNLADYRPIKSVRASGSGVYDASVYYPYNVKWTEADGVLQMSVQLASSQAPTAINPSVAIFTRVLPIRLRQNGDDIEGILDCACYMPGYVILGEDIEKTIARHQITPESGFNPDTEVHTPDYGRGYGVSHLLMKRKDAARVEFRGTVASTLNLELSENSVSVSGGSVTSAVYGRGELAFETGESTATDPCTDDYPGFIAGSAVVIASNRMLTTLTNVTAEITGSYVSGIHYPAIFCQYQGDNLCGTGEVQVATDVYTWRFVRVELKQDGLNVKAKALSAGWVKSGSTHYDQYVGTHSVYEAQFDTARTECTPSTSDKGQPVGACAYRFFYSEPAAQSVSPDFHNAMTPDTIVSATQFPYGDLNMRVSGSVTQRMLVNLTHGYSAPTNGIVEVGAGGELVYDITDATSKPAAPELIHVAAGGKLRIRRNDSLPANQQIILDGGWLSFRDDLIETYGDTWTVLNQLTLRDGAKVTGARIRFGSQGTAAWRVAGTSPSVCEAPLLLVSLSSGQTLNIVDVTDDDGIDFVLKGGITSYGVNSSVLHKIGGGTLAHYGTCNTGSKISIEGGTWLLTGNESSAQSYTLKGGTLGTADGTTNVVGPLNVEGTGTIRTGDCSTLAFADSSSVAWTGTGRIDIDADLEHDAVRFGTSASALTPAQLARLRTNGHHVLLDENGYARENVTGFMMLVK